jgi:2-C-methyl-D-erythritol 4-phosphate cytidylyltransferase
MAARGQLTVAAIVVAGGSGARLGADVAKAFVPVAGRTLLEHAAARLLSHPRVRDVVAAVPAEQVTVAQRLVPEVLVVGGGPSRQLSVSRALAQVGDDVDVVLVHDAARAFAPADLITRVIEAMDLEGADESVDGAVPILPAHDSMRLASSRPPALGAVVDRRTLAIVQTPQAFRRAALVRAHEQASGSDATDDAILVEAVGGRLVAVAGAADAFKITYPFDLLVAEVLAAR